MDHSFWMIFSEENQINAIRKTNEYTNQYGLCLTDYDIRELLNRHRECLTDQQRVEFGNGILEKMIYAFCDSDFIYQDNYVETIAGLQSIFYLYKNESMDELTDDELITVMRNAFDEECRGSLEYLEETYLENFARNIRANTNKFIGRYTKDHEKI